MDVDMNVDMEINVNLTDGTQTEQPLPQTTSSVQSVAEKSQNTAILSGTTDDDTPPMADEDAMEVLEAILFAAGHPMTFERLADTLNLSIRTVKRLVLRMQKEKYDGHGIQLLMLGESCQLCTVERHREYIKKALGIRRGGNLSKNSFEVLAIVAYNQPVTRSFVDEVRGVDSSYIMSSLEDKGLIESKGRLDLPGRPTLWGTSVDFLRVFGLISLKQLPPADVFLRPESGIFAEQIALALDDAEQGTEATNCAEANDSAEIKVAAETENTVETENTAET